MKRILLVLAVLAIAAGAIFFVRSPRATGVLHAVELARPERVFTARFSVPTEYRVCERRAPHPDSIVPRETCGEPGDAPSHIARLAQADESLDPDSLQASALAAVMWWHGEDASLNGAIERLSDALRMDGDSVPLLVDLSAAHMARAQETQNSRDLAEALNRAREALALEPGNLPALFNAALAMEALPLVEQATAAWDAYLAADRSSPWRSEAQERRERLKLPPDLPHPTLASTDAAVDSFTARDPNKARTLGEAALGEWGNAVLNDSAARADSSLRLAERLGKALEQVGDTTLADELRAIHAARSNPSDMRALSLAHRAHAAGQELYAASNVAAARDSFQAVLTFEPPSLVLRQWASVFRAGATVRLGEFSPLMPVFDSLLTQIDTVRHVAIAARAQWMWGAALSRSSDSEKASEHQQQAVRMFDRFGDVESSAFNQSEVGLQAYMRGDTLKAYSLYHEALLALQPYRNSVRLHNALFTLAEIVGRDGMPEAAATIQDEDFEVAMRVGGVVAPEALLARARFRAISGKTRLAQTDLESAAKLVDKLNVEAREKHFENVIEYSSDFVAAALNQTPSPESLNNAVESFTGRNDVWRLAVLMRRADLRLSTGNSEGARTDLDSITALVGRSPEMLFHQRAAVIEQARSRFDQLVMLHVRAGRPREALLAMQRAHVSFSPGDDAAPATGQLKGPARGVAVQYALIGDTLLTWAVQGDSVSLVRQRVPRQELLSTADRLAAALETPGREAVARSHQQRLYDWLIRPVQDRLGERETPLVIILDTEIAGVPFVSLWDAQRGRYLVHDHPLRHASSLDDAARPAPAPDPAGLRALLVANPTFNPAEHPTLDPLGGADAEVRSLRALYRNPVTLRGTDATVDALRSQAPRASVIHYAGHAVFDDTRPERSFLVLAGDGELAADAVGSLDLRGVRLVVLSACSTLRARQGRSGGFAGLSGELLSAGAGGVLGSLWKVDDDLTQPLMLAFHRAYLRSGDPAAALRQAQLEMLNSGDPRRSSPAAWAGFRYMGR